MKKVIISVFMAFFMVIVASPVLASENDSLESLLELGTITYQDDEITVINLGNDPEIADLIAGQQNSFEIQPFATGSGGSASITAGDNGRILYWTVKPNSLWPYIFQGNVNLAYYSGYKRNAPIGGDGLLGMPLSGFVTMKKNKGGYATLSGTAYSMDFSKRTVLPGTGTAY